MIDFIIKIFTKPLSMITFMDCLIMFGLVVFILLASYGLWCITCFTYTCFVKYLKEKKSRHKKGDD